MTGSKSAAEGRAVGLRPIASYQDEAGLWMLKAERGNHSQEHINAFATFKAPDKKKVDEIVLFRRDGCSLAVFHAVGNDCELPRAELDAVILLHGLGDTVADGANARRPLHGQGLSR